MKLSIITPVLNDLRIVQCLNSVIAQQHEHDLELIVIDGGSTDGTLDVLETYKDKIAVLVSEPDAGIYDAMNKGIGMATGDIVGILNADDQYLSPYVIRDVLNAFSDEHTDACYGDLVYTNDAGNIFRYWKTGSYRRAKWYFGWVPPHPTFFVRKHLYDKYGAFDLRFPVAADYELMLRLMFKHRINVKYLNQVLVNMASGGNATRSILTILKAKLELTRAWRCNGLRGGLLVPIPKIVRNLFQFVRHRPSKQPPLS